MIRRGEIYFVQLDPATGREQRGRRPVLVVSSDALNRLPLVVTVIAGTDSANISHDYPTNLRLTSHETGLPHDTVFLGFQLRSLDPARFVDSETGLATPAGRLPDIRLPELDEVLRNVLGLQ